MESTWINPEISLLELYKLPHNIFGLTNNINKDELFVSQQKIRDIARFVGNRARKKDYTGAKLFVRAEYIDDSQSDRNWWLDAEGIIKLNHDLQDLSDVDVMKYHDEITALCKEYFAEFGQIHRIVTLSLPKGENVIGIMQSSTLGKINPYLESCMEKIYFPITNSEWIREFNQF